MQQQKVYFSKEKTAGQISGNVLVAHNPTFCQAVDQRSKVEGQI